MKRLAFMVLLCVACLCACSSNKGSNSAAGLGSYTVSGLVVSGNDALAGVTVTLSGSADGTAVTDADGKYSFSGLRNGNYTVAPSLGGYTFYPVGLAVTVKNADLKNQNISATPTAMPTYSLSGTVKTPDGSPLDGAKIVLSGPSTGSTYSDENGNYQLSGLLAGNYTATVSKTGITFSVTSLYTTVADGDVTGVDFASVEYLISGTVVSGGGSPMQNVTVTLTGITSAIVTTDADGKYSFPVMANGNYTVTPSLTGYAFSPASTAVTLNSAGVGDVNFAAQSYSISGTVTSSGLAFAGATVTLTGYDITPVQVVTGSDGFYSFPVTRNGIYVLTPSKTGFQFTDENRIITVDGNDVTDVNFSTTNHWVNPSGLNDHISAEVQNGSLSYSCAMDRYGNAIIVWAQSDGSTTQIFKSEYRNGAWIHPANLDCHISFAGTDAVKPSVAMDDNGNAIIAWAQSDGSSRQIFKSEYRNQRWTYPSGLNDHINPDDMFLPGANNPKVAMDNNGNALIVWDQFGYVSDIFQPREIFKSEYRNGTWTHPADQSDFISPGDTFAIIASSVVAMDDNGNAIIAWTQTDDTNYKIFKSEYRNGAWTHPADLNDNINPDGTMALNGHLAMDNSGNAVIVWQQFDASNNMQIYKSEYRNGVWTHPANLADFISFVGGRASWASVAMDDNGNALIVWTQYDGSNKQIFKSEYRNGAWTGPSSLLDNISPDGQDAGDSWVAMDDNGNALIVWVESDGTNDRIFKSEYRYGTWWAPSSLGDAISPSGTDAYSPFPIMSDSGDALILWIQSDGAFYNVFMSEYRTW